ncbi:MAG: hypothetical protein GY810_13725 [Aureispira sp.]|nr:hypothetical protein [Aureispira sp.]
MNTLTREAMKRLCNSRMDWAKEWPRIQTEVGFYYDISVMGRTLVDEVVRRQNLEAVQAAFDTIESCLDGADSELISLIGAGMFEAMQGAAYRTLDPPDYLDRFMGERALDLWQGIIEGWTGDGIRTMEEWGNVLVNGITLKVEIIRHKDNLKWFVERQEDETVFRSLDIDGKEVLKEVIKDKAAIKEIFQFFHPLKAEKSLGYARVSSDPDGFEYPKIDTSFMGFKNPYATIKIIQPRYPNDGLKELVIGALVEDGQARYVNDSDWIVLLSNDWEQFLRV